MSPEVAAAVAKLYRVFATQPSHVMEICPCCDYPADSERLRRGRREELPSKVLGRYAFHAMLTWGDERDFCWFLPRIAEVVAAERGLGDIDVARFAELCRSAGWAKWSADRRSALAVYFDTLWHEAIDSVRPPENLIDASAKLDLALVPWIAIVEARDAVRFLAELVTLSILSDGPEIQRLRPLVVRASTQERLLTAYVVTPHERIAYAYDLLSWMGDLPP